MEACMVSRRVGECVFNRLLMLVAKRFAISKGSETTGAREPIYTRPRPPASLRNGDSTVDHRTAQLSGLR